MASERNGVPESSSQRFAAPNALENPSPQASSSPRWCASSAITSVPGVQPFAHAAGFEAMRA